MSYQHTQRRKTVKRFKGKYGDKWYTRFREHVDGLVAERLGPPIGTLEEIVTEARRQGKWLNPRKSPSVNSLPK